MEGIPRRDCYKPLMGFSTDHIESFRATLALRWCHRSTTPLRRLPGLRLQKLSGNRDGQHSIRINDRYRICFRWEDDEAQDVEITDYH